MLKALGSTSKLQVLNSSKWEGVEETYAQEQKNVPPSAKGTICNRKRKERKTQT
jgi:hypothetical protein